MKDLIFDRESGNLGGISQLVFFAENEVNVFGDIIAGQIYEILFLDQNIEPATADIIPYSSNFSEVQKAPDLFEYEFTCKIAKDEIDKRTALLLVDNNKLIAKVTDNNNEIRLIGEPGNACIVESTLDKGVGVSDTNHYLLTFTWKNRFRAPFANELYIATADYECLNPVVPVPVAAQDYTTSIDIKNNSPHNYTATQNFELQGIGSDSVTKTIAANSTETFEVTFSIPANAIGFYNLIRTGECESTEQINVPNYATYKEASALVVTTDSEIILYDDAIIIEDGTVTHSGNAVLFVEDNKIKVSNAGTVYDLQFEDDAANQYRFPVAEQNGWTLHDVRQVKMAIVNNCSWATQNELFYNLQFGATKVIDDDTANIIYVPYSGTKTKIYAP